MKIRAENLIAAVGELRVGLLTVRNLADMLLSLVEAADAPPRALQVLTEAYPALAK